MISMAARECFAGAYGPSYLEIPRDVLDREIPVDSAVIPEPGHYRASTKSIGDPKDIERLADILVKAKTPCILLGTQVWNCRGHNEAIRLVRELNIPAYFNGSGRGLLPPGDPALLQPHPLARLQGSRRHRHRRHAVRLPHGLRQAALEGSDHRPDRSGLPHRRQEPRRDPRLAGDPGAILGAVADAASGRADNGARREKAGWSSCARRRARRPTS